jgi:hypothetical protein
MPKPKREPGSSSIAALLREVEKHIDALARSTEREFRDLHHSINYRFERAHEQLDTIEGKIGAFARRVDDEVEQRHKLGDRLSKVEERL